MCEVCVKLQNYCELHLSPFFPASRLFYEHELRRHPLSSISSSIHSFVSSPKDGGCVDKNEDY